MHFAHTPQFTVCHIDHGSKKTTITFQISEDLITQVEPVSRDAFLTLRGVKVGRRAVDIDMVLNLCEEE